MRPWQFRPFSSMVPHGGRPPVVVVGVEEKAWAPTARAPSTMVRKGGIGLTVPFVGAKRVCVRGGRRGDDSRGGSRPKYKNTC